MLKRAILLLGLILVVFGIFCLAEKFDLPVLWLVGFIAIGILTRYGSLILIGGNAERVLSYFKRRPAVRIKVVSDVLKRKQLKLDDLKIEEVAALLIITMAQDSIDEAHTRASMFQAEIFDSDFFQYVLRVLNDFRTIGLNRDFQLQLISFSESLARKHQLAEWAGEFQRQREIVFKRHAESIPVIRAPR